MSRARDEKGIALIGVLVMLVTLMALVVTLSVTVSSDSEMRGAFASTTIGFYAAESGLNKAMGEYRNIFLNYEFPESSDFAARSFDLGEREVTYDLTERPGYPKNILIPSGEVFAGLNANEYRYTVNSEARDVNDDIEASVGAEFLIRYIPLFQFAAFYTNDLEILPGANMVLNGRVHSNANLYMNSDASLSVADNSAAGIYTVQVSAADHIYRGRKDKDECKGVVSVDKLEDVVAPSNDLDPKELTCDGTSTRVVSSSELSVWQGSMLDQVENISVPEPDVIDRIGGDFWKKADLRIVLVLNKPDSLPAGPEMPHSIEVQDSNGTTNDALTTQLRNFIADDAWNALNSSLPGTRALFYTDVPLSTGGCACADGVPTCGNNTASCYNPTFLAGGLLPLDSRVYSATMNLDGDYRRGGFYNHREKKWMLLLNINVSDLLLWNQQNGEPFFSTTDTTQGGIVIFASVVGPNSNVINNYGVRVFGSANLPIPGGINASSDPTGLTVVSDQAMYLLGDFNRGTVNAGDLPEQPAALIGDSINVLSNNYWSATCLGTYCRDGQSVRGLDEVDRDGADTRINSAFLGGVDTTPAGYAGSYNGGLENFPRFHEDWGGRILTYQGSFVSLGQPEHVNGAWCGTGSACNIYNPPNRNWNYNSAYNMAENLPPFTPRSLYLQQVLFSQERK
jgi:hypothetical protein